MREAEKVLTAYLREHPSDKAQRTFLFELLCFAGEYARAEKQLSVLSGGGVESETGAIVYYAALHAEKTRHELFEKQAFPSGPTVCPTGTLNGKPFTELRDADPDIGARLEVFAAGSYVWIPFEHIASVEMGKPVFRVFSASVYLDGALGLLRQKHGQLLSAQYVYENKQFKQEVR